jgi:membrane-bound serine protease (ClpP class)
MLKTRHIIIALLALLVLSPGIVSMAVEVPEQPATEQAEQVRKVMVITVEGVINPVSSEFITWSIEKANEEGMEALVIELDTPGGLMESMRSIIKDMLGSDVPVVVFVAPHGARAASAGTFITIAAHVAAMAPQTNIGAAHPVGVGQDMNETMAGKVTNDAAAYIRSLAERRGRNAEWAEDAVRKSVSATEEEAIAKGVIDLVTKDVNSLLHDIDGWNVETVAGKRTLHTKGATVIREEMGLRHRILDIVSNPNIAYILMILGFYGLFFELTNPGAIFPGVLGGICLILAFYAFQTLPVNYAGLLLIALAIILFILETQIASFGVLTIGGIISMILGSIMLFESGAPFMKLSLAVVFTTVLATAAFFLAVVGLAVKAHRRKPVTGSEGLVGLEGKAVTDISGRKGQVSVHGELWSAFSDEPIEKDENVVVESLKGFKVKVRKTKT